MSGAADGIDEPVRALSLEQTSQLTGLSPRQLRYWHDSGFFPPEHSAYTGRAFGRVYSFRDVVGLRTLALLRNDHDIPLQKLRRVHDWLLDHSDRPWSELTFYVRGKDVFFDIPSSGERAAGEPKGQTALPIEMAKIARDTRAAIGQMRRRPPQVVGQIDRNRHIQHNSPVVAGTRIPTWTVWDLHEDGLTTDEILERFPDLQARDVQAAIEWERDRRSEKKRAG